MLCIPRIPDCGGLMIGVESMEPNTPPLEIVNVPPVISSTVICPSRALIARRLISASTPLNDSPSALRTTGTINPFGPETATLISQ